MCVAIRFFFAQAQMKGGHEGGKAESSTKGLNNFLFLDLCLFFKRNQLILQCTTNVVEAFTFLKIDAAELRECYYKSPNCGRNTISSTTVWLAKL
jgi:hypothetical protein